MKQKEQERQEQERQEQETSRTRTPRKRAPGARTPRTRATGAKTPRTRATGAKTPRQERQEQKRQAAELAQPVDFHGKQLIKAEVGVLQALEQSTGKPFQPGTTAPGFTVENQHVTRLDLNGLGLSSLPEAIGNLNSLQILDLEL